MLDGPDLDFFEKSLDTFTQDYEEFNEQGSISSYGIDEKSKREWIASSLGVSSKELELLEVEKGSVNAYPGIYYCVTIAGLQLAIRSDRLQAYLCVLPEEIPTDNLQKTIQQICRIVCCDQKTFTVRLGALKKGQWLLVAGAEILSSTEVSKTSSFVYLEDVNLNNSYASYKRALDLCQIKNPRFESLSLLPFTTNEKAIETRDLQMSYLHQDIFGIETEASKPENITDTYELDENLQREKNGIIQSKRYGYLVLHQTMLKLRPAFHITSDKSSCLWLILGKHKSGISSEIILSELKILGVTHGIQYDLIKELTESKGFDEKNSVYILAKSIAPINGENSYLKVFENDTPKAKDDPEDNADVDHHLNATIVMVEKGDLVAQKVPATAGVSGNDVIGNRIEQHKGKDTPIHVGGNISTTEKEGKIEYRSKVNGLLKTTNNSISITEVLCIDGNVDFNSGNINFPGDILVKGSISSGFSVTAGGDINVIGTIEDGANVTAFGNLSVKAGIVGSKTRVVVKGSLNARFIQQSSVAVNGDVNINDHLYHANVRSESKIIIKRRSTSQKGGSIIGGYTWGLMGLDLHFAGSTNAPETILGSGPDRLLILEVKKLKNFSDQQHKQVLHLVKICGITGLDQTSLQHAFQEADEKNNQVKKRYLNRLVELIHSYKKTIEQTKLRESVLQETLRKLDVIVRNRTFPKVQFYYGNQYIKTNREQLAPVFKIKDGVFIYE